MQLVLTGREALFDSLVYHAVPNTEFCGHEADLLCLSGSGLFHEVEIKVSRTDLKADKRKAYHVNQRQYPVWQRSDRREIACLWYAVPFELVNDCIELAPPHAGIVGVSLKRVIREKWCWSLPGLPREYIDEATVVVRKPKKNVTAHKPEPDVVNQFLRLGVIKMWKHRLRVQLVAAGIDWESYE